MFCNRTQNHNRKILKKNQKKKEKQENEIEINDVVKGNETTININALALSRQIYKWLGESNKFALSMFFFGLSYKFLYSKIIHLSKKKSYRAKEFH